MADCQIVRSVGELRYNRYYVMTHILYISWIEMSLDCLKNARSQCCHGANFFSLCTILVILHTCRSGVFNIGIVPFYLFYLFIFIQLNLSNS